MKPILGFLLTLGLFLAVSCGEVNMPAPDGPYAVGTAVFDMTDTARIDSNGGVYMYTVRIWYPAASTNGCKQALANEKELIAAMEKYQGMPGIMMDAGATTGAWADAPVSNTSVKWPVVVFNHGAFSFDRQNQAQMARIASRGYAVIAVSQPGLSLLTRFENGRTVTVDETKHRFMTEYYKNSLPDYNRVMTEVILSNAAAIDNEWRLTAISRIPGIPFYEFLRPVFEVTLSNNLHLIQNLDALAARTGIALDGGNVSVVGHSLGGIVAGELARLGLTNLRVCVNYDSPQMVFSTHSGPLRTPTAFFMSTEQKMGGTVLDMSHLNDYFVDTALNDCWRIVVKGTAHMSFSDLTYVEPLKFMGLTGSIDGTRAGTIVHGVTLALLDYYQKGADSPLLKENGSPWPEAEIRKGPR